MNVIAAFCGTGKSFLCRNYPTKYIELECWKYRSGNFPDNYIKEIKECMDKVEQLLISTDPIVLNQLHNDDINILLVYPDNSLKEEYMKRYCDRNDGYDFIGVMYRHFDDWINEIKNHNYGKHIVLKSGEYLSQVINHL